MTAQLIVDNAETRLTRRRYDCIAPIYDALEWMMEWRAGRLSEARRVLKPGGQLLLLEHVLSRRAALRRIMQWLDPIRFHIWGAHIERDTADAVRAAGFVDVREAKLSLDVVKRGEAKAPAREATVNSDESVFGSEERSHGQASHK